MFFMVFFNSCTDEEDFQNSITHEDNIVDTISHIDYPSTAHVIHNAVADIDGNSYDAVQIGNQIWMASNLRTTHEPDGEEIPEGSNIEPAAIPYRYTPHSNVTLYGYLYNYDAILHGFSPSITNPSGVQGICPNGWHVPSLIEWQEMVNYVKNHVSTEAAITLVGNCGWDRPWWEYADPNIVNMTGFSALPAGCVYIHQTHSYWYTDQCDYVYTQYKRLGSVAHFGTAADRGNSKEQGIAICTIYYDNYTNTNNHRIGYSSMPREYQGCSVRCVKD